MQQGSRPRFREEAVDQVDPPGGANRLTSTQKLQPLNGKPGLLPASRTAALSVASPG